MFIFQLSQLFELHLSSNKFNGSVQLNKFLELRNLDTLDLSYSNLTVTVNVTTADQSSLPNISELHLASCNLKTFPNFLKNQSKLTSLDLSNNQIRGTVPNWIWKLERLDNLNISHNLLTDLEGPLQNLNSYVSFIDLHENQLQGPMPIFNNFSFYLDYSSNKFSSVIPQDIGDYLSYASFLSLSNNTFHGSIPVSLCNASALIFLDLSINKISGMIPSCLMITSNTLQLLNLQNNNLTGPIPNTIPKTCALLTVNLHGNLLDGSIPKSLAHCSNLQVLDLGLNQIIGGFPCFLEKISALRVLILRNNKFQGFVGCKKTKKTWQMLQIVDISFNNFCGKLPRKYFINWKQMMHDKHQVGSMFVEMKAVGGYLYYQQVTVIAKGNMVELHKILKIFTAIDLSSNHFEGPIPEELMDFKALHVLNLSNNAFSGEIPSSIGNLKQLESLDLSQNSLSGEIPLQLASLSFLSYLNLSFNHLVGRIPTGTQLQSFQASSYEGNDGLYGPPLIDKTNSKEPMLLPQPSCRRIACTIDWNFVSVELGFLFGLGIVLGPLLFSKRWKVWYWQLVPKILCWIFPQLYLEYATQRGQMYVVLRWWG